MDYRVGKSRRIKSVGESYQVILFLFICHLIFRNYLEGFKQNRQTVTIEENLNRNNYDIPSDNLEYNENEILGRGITRNEMHQLLTFLGGSGKVLRGIWLGTTPVAVKILHSLPG